MKNLTCITGNVPFREFVEWLQSFMVYGSDQKVFRCGSGAYRGVKDLLKIESHGFRALPNSGEHNFQTPFGKAILKEDASLSDGEIIVKDLGICDHPRIMNNAESYAERILCIETPQ